MPPSGGIEGITANDVAGGATDVSATGQVTSTSGYGIVAINGATTLSSIATPTFTVSAGNATDLTIALNGTTENASGRMTDLAVKTTGGTTSAYRRRHQQFWRRCQYARQCQRRHDRGACLALAKRDDRLRRPDQLRQS